MGDRDPKERGGVARRQGREREGRKAEEGPPYQTAKGKRASYADTAIAKQWEKEPPPPSLPPPLFLLFFDPLSRTGQDGATPLFFFLVVLCLDGWLGLLLSGGQFNTPMRRSSVAEEEEERGSIGSGKDTYVHSCVCVWI